MKFKILFNGEIMENFVFGRNNVIELLENDSRKISKIILAENMKGNSKITQIIDIAKSKGIVFQFLPKEKFLPKINRL